MEPTTEGVLLSDLVLRLKNNQTYTTTWSEVHAAAARLKRFMAAVGDRLVGRALLGEKITYALGLREHVLVYGPTGSAKSFVMDMLSRGVTGARTFEYQFTRMDGIASVLGPYDVRIANEHGALVHRTEGTLADCHFAILDEVLDANTALLRAKLRLLMERELMRGAQKISTPLMTAVGATNLDPHALVAQDPQLAAPIDRFLFVERVDYLGDPLDRLAMFRIYLELQQEYDMPPLALQDIALVSAVVLRANLLTNEFLLKAYEELTRRFDEARGEKTSDRRACKALQTLELSALLRGARSAGWEDLAAARFALVTRPGDEGHFSRICEEVIETWSVQHRQAVQSNDLVALEALEQLVPEELDPSGMGATELVDTKRRLSGVLERVKAVTVNSVAAIDKRSQLIVRLELMIQELIQSI